jgi:tetratricopeptide (TPR) repeat protein
MKKFLKAEALALVRKGDIQPGIDKWQEYLALPDNAADDDAWASLGGAFRRQGQIDRALECYRRAYELNPESTYALVNLVSLQAARNTPEDREHLAQDVLRAIGLCRDVIERNGATFWNWYDLATLYLIQGSTEDAMKTLFHAIALTPDAAKENFRSVLNNLRFLHERNPAIAGLADAIAIVSQHAS